jgi:hypothetical protein
LKGLKGFEEFKGFKENPTAHGIAVEGRLSHSFFSLLLQAKTWSE